MRVERNARGPLRRRLLLLAGASIVPLALMAGVGLWALAQQQRLQAERVGLELARAVATAVHAELRSAVSVLESLATASALDHGDLADFRERARRVVDTRPEWLAVLLADLSGRRLVDSRHSDARPFAPVVERPSFDEVVRAGSAAVGNLARGPGGALLFPVRVPVVRQGELRYVLTAIVKPEAIRDVVTRQGVPPDWVISIFDAHGRRVARSRAHAENLGGEAAPTVRALMASESRQGFGITYTLEGERIYTPYSRIEPYGWSAALGIPTALVEAAVFRSVAVYGGGILASIALGAAVAVGVARSINRPIAHLRAAAQALGRGEPVTAPDTPIQEIHEVAAALVAAADERTRSEAQREELLRKEQQARAAAEEADRAKDQFLAVLSHELRTPLNAVYGWARMIRTGQVQGEEATRRALEVIERNASVQVQLVDDLLDVSRVISGKMRLDVRALDLGAVVQAALDAVRPAAQAKGIRLSSALDPGAGPVAGDPDRLQQVAWNLLINAVKFTPKDGHIEVRVQRATSHVELVVTDTGQGIARELLAVIFDRFRQADSSTTRSHGGLGLGLALVKHLVELHGGTVAAHSAGEGQGATFVVALPLSLVPMPAAAETRGHPTAPPVDGVPAGGARLDGLRVLVVDDEADALALATAILTAAGATVRCCASAPDALETLRGWRPDVLVSDIEMPGEDGHALIRRVRALPADDGGRTPAVALTAYGRIQDRTQSLAAGYTMHVPKPVDPGELTTIVASIAQRGGPS